MLAYVAVSSFTGYLSRNIGVSLAPQVYQTCNMGNQEQHLMQRARCHQGQMARRVLERWQLVLTNGNPPRSQPS